MEIALIARCPEHGLHGERSECFACHGPVEQVPMVAADYFSRDELDWLEGAARRAAANTFVADEALIVLGRKLARLARGPSLAT